MKICERCWGTSRSSEPRMYIRGFGARTSMGAHTVAMLLLMLAAIGCRPNRPGAHGPHEYFGPTQTMAEVVSEINANAERIPTLWARFDYFEVKIVQKDGKSDTVNGDGGTLMFRKPRDLRVNAA